MGNLFTMNNLIGAGIILAAWKFAPNASVKTGAIAVAAIVVAQQLPYTSDLLAA